MWNVMLRQPVDGSAKFIMSLFIMYSAPTKERNKLCSVVCKPKMKRWALQQQPKKSKDKMINKGLIQSDTILRRRHNASHCAQIVNITEKANGVSFRELRCKVKKQGQRRDRWKRL